MGAAPAQHAEDHASGGSDALNPANIGADWNKLENKPSTFSPSDHAAVHEEGGSDALDPENIGADWDKLVNKPATFPATLSSLEGDYTTWTIQAIYDTNAAKPLHYALFIRNDGQVVYHDWQTRKVYIISPAGALLATLTDLKATDYHPLTWWSLQYRYICFKDDNNDNVVVLEGIAELWKRAAEDDKGGHTLLARPVQDISMSQSGEWIASMVKDSASKILIFIYKGS